MNILSSILMDLLLLFPISLVVVFALQALSAEIMQALSLPKNFNELLPMHIHMGACVLRDTEDTDPNAQNPITIIAPPPPHFQWTCERLKLCESHEWISILRNPWPSSSWNCILCTIIVTKYWIKTRFVISLDLKRCLNFITCWSEADCFLCRGIPGRFFMLPAPFQKLLCKTLVWDFFSSAVNSRNTRGSWA